MTDVLSEEDLGTGLVMGECCMDVKTTTCKMGQRTEAGAELSQPLRGIHFSSSLTLLFQAPGFLTFGIVDFCCPFCYGDPHKAAVLVL